MRLRMVSMACVTALFFRSVKAEGFIDKFQELFGATGDVELGQPFLHDSE